jgi:Na+(H+)/acetate symporter ActP
MVSAPVAFAFIAVLGGVLALWASAMQRGVPREEAVPRTITSMSHVGRITFAAIAVVFIVLGIVAQSPVALVGGVAFIIAAAGQHWVHEQWRP